MKNTLKFLGVAALAMTLTTEKAQALDIGTSFGAFSLTSPQLASPNDPRVTPPTEYVNYQDFRLVDGSFRTAEGGIGTDDAAFDGTVNDGYGPLNRITAATPDGVEWWGSATRAFEYAYGFAQQLINTPPPPSSSNTLLKNFIDTSASMIQSFAFAYNITSCTEPNPDDCIGFVPIVSAFAVTVDNTGAVDVGDNPGQGDFGNVSIAEARFFEDFETTGSLNANLVYAVSSKKFGFEGVPEIDGPVLVQVGFALMGLYVLMLGRRRREDEVDMSQAA